MVLKINIEQVKIENPLWVNYFEVKFDEKETILLIDKFEILNAIGNELGIEITDITYNNKDAK